jgi:hypothetical protein
MEWKGEGGREVIGVGIYEIQLNTYYLIFIEWNGCISGWAKQFILFQFHSIPLAVAGRQAEAKEKEKATRFIFVSSSIPFSPMREQSRSPIPAFLSRSTSIYYYTLKTST